MIREDRNYGYSLLQMSDILFDCDYANNHDHFELPRRRERSTNAGIGSRRRFPLGRGTVTGVRDFSESPQLSSGRYRGSRFNIRLMDSIYIKTQFERCCMTEDGPNSESLMERQTTGEDLSLTHKSSQDFSGTGTGSASTTEILGIHSFNTSLEQL